MEILQSDTHYGATIELEGMDIVPVSNSVCLRAKRFPLSVRWERPVGVFVHDGAGEEQFVPIADVTRRVQIVVILISAAFWLLTRRWR